MLIFVLFAAQELGAYTLLSNGECNQACSGDDSKGNCGFGCQDCSCCGHPAPVIPNQVATIIPISAPVKFNVPPPGGPVARDPHKIFHIPKSVLA